MAQLMPIGRVRNGLALILQREVSGQSELVTKHTEIFLFCYSRILSLSKWGLVYYKGSGEILTINVLFNTILFRV